jgi:hypothetical protein
MEYIVIYEFRQKKIEIINGLLVAVKQVLITLMEKEGERVIQKRTKKGQKIK